VAQAVHQIYVLLRLREATYVSQDIIALHLTRETDREKTMGIVE
jgi:hypothetical protein